MINKALIIKILEKYLLDLQMRENRFDQSELNATLRCIDFINDNDKINSEWVISNSSVLSRATEYYRKILKNEIEEARAYNDCEALATLRNEREQLLRFVGFLTNITQQFQV